MIVYLVARRSEHDLVDIATNVSMFSWRHRRHVVELLQFFASTAMKNTTISEMCVEGIDIRAVVTSTVVLIVDQTTSAELCHSVISLLNSSDLVTAQAGLHHAQTFRSRVSQIHEDIDQSKTIMINVINKAILRQDELDRLVASTSELSAQSKQFYNRARRMNTNCFQRFCIIM